MLKSKCFKNRYRTYTETRTITVCTARPGIIIGKGGQEVDKLKEERKKVTDKDIQINIFEVKRPELDAVIVANNIARQVEGKIAYRRAIKMAIANTMPVWVRKVSKFRFQDVWMVQNGPFWNV